MQDVQGTSLVILSRGYPGQSQDGKQKCLSSVCVSGGQGCLSCVDEFKARVTECSCAGPEGAVDAALAAPAVASRGTAKSAASKSLGPIISLYFTTAPGVAGGAMGDFNEGTTTEQVT